MTAAKSPADFDPFSEIPDHGVGPDPRTALTTGKSGDAEIRPRNFAPIDEQPPSGILFDLKMGPYYTD